MPFTGFGSEAIEFYVGLEADNSKAWFQAHKAIYDVCVKGSFEALAQDVADTFKPMRLFRPNRDVRFSTDKSPYKTAAAAMSESEGGAIYYVQLSAQGLMAATGYYAMATDQLQRFRDAIADERTGPELAAITEALTRSGYDLGAVGELKTAPRGFAKDHERISLLRRKGLVAGRSWAPAAWMHTRKALGRIEDAWHGADAMNAWLDHNVGPSELPPDEGGRGR